jgi:Recombination endonuclease VII
MVTDKFCPDCGDFRPVAEFTRDKRRRGGLAFYCAVHTRQRVTESKRRRLGPPRHRYRAGEVPEGHKWCPDCDTVKPLDEFPATRAAPSGRHTYCKPCHNVRGKASKDKVGGSRTYHLKRRYGITAEDADAMLKAQGGLCAICGVLPAEHVDHDHATGVVRQLLCFNCNGGLGQFKDDPDVLRAAAAYVERHRERQVAGTDRPADTRPGRSSAHQRRVRARLLAMREYDAGRVPNPLPAGLLVDD